MTDDLQTPALNGDLDRGLVAAGRFSPKPGFENRVLSFVRHPLPRWLRHTRDALRGMLSGPRGWVILATFSAATAAAWGSVVVAGIQFRGYVSEGTDIAIREWGLPAWREALIGIQNYWDVVRSTVQGWVGQIGVPLTTLLIVYAGVTLVSLLALRKLSTEPSRLRGSI
jgi:hypothetical protein